MKENEDVLKIIIEKLDNLIIECEEQADIFDKINMEIGSISSDAMKHAYINIKNFIQNIRK